MYTCGIAKVVVAWRCGEDKNSRNFFSGASQNGNSMVKKLPTTRVLNHNSFFFYLSVSNNGKNFKMCRELFVVWLSVVKSLKTLLNCL